jgi:Cytochrome oxidase complex assembly protein 1
MSFDYSNPNAMNATFPGPEQKPRGWWSRNWKWFVPTLFLCLILMCGGCLGGIAIIFISGLKHMEPYVVTMEKIQADKEAQEAFGQPIRDDSWFPVMGTAGNDLHIRWDLVGPKGKGKADVTARLNNKSNKLEIVVIEVTLPNGKKITLHDEGGGDVAPPFNPQGAAPAEKAKEESDSKPELTPNIPAADENEPGK